MPWSFHQSPDGKLKWWNLVSLVGLVFGTSGFAVSPGDQPSDIPGPGEYYDGMARPETTTSCAWPVKTGKTCGNFGWIWSNHKHLLTSCWRNSFWRSWWLVSFVIKSIFRHSLIAESCHDDLYQASWLCAGVCSERPADAHLKGARPVTSSCFHMVKPPWVSGHSMGFP